MVQLVNKVYQSLLHEINIVSLIFHPMHSMVYTKVKKIRPGIESVKAGVQKFNRGSDWNIIKIYIYLIIYIYKYIHMIN